MKQLFTTVLLIGFNASLFSQTAVSKKLDSLLTALEANNKAMGSLAIRHNGKLVYSKAIGFSSSANGQQVNATPATVYRIGSITKPILQRLFFN